MHAYVLVGWAPGAQLGEAPESGLGDYWHGEISRLQTPTGFPALYLLERPSALSHQKDKPIEGRQSGYAGMSASPSRG